MKTLEEIKNKFAKNNNYKNWSEFMILNSRNSILIEKAMDEIIMLVQKEQQKLIAGNVFNANNYTVEDGIQLITDNKIKSSIINENNIIRWKY